MYKKYFILLFILTIVIGYALYAYYDSNYGKILYRTVDCSTPLIDRSRDLVFVAMPLSDSELALNYHELGLFETKPFSTSIELERDCFLLKSIPLTLLGSSFYNVGTSEQFTRRYYPEHSNAAPAIGLIIKDSNIIGHINVEEYVYIDIIRHKIIVPTWDITIKTANSVMYNEPIVLNKCILKIGIDYDYHVKCSQVREYNYLLLPSRLNVRVGADLERSIPVNSRIGIYFLVPLHIIDTENK